ncbi:MAG TPA: alpha-galactosidase, partial [Candidatus Limnocylindrales bacterium]|nr:alpha-galactosidase [Candidatus Limnocylindrales bacterium]
MPIDWLPETREWHLRNERVAYLLRVLDNGWLGHLWFGPPLAAGRSYAHLGARDFRGFANRVGEPVPLELPTPEGGDFRVPGLAVELADGSSVLDLRYVAHTIRPGKPELPGLPATYVEAADEADTLEVTVRDEPSGLEATLAYTLFRDRPLVARSMRLTNRGPAALVVRCAMSAVLDLPDARWELVGLSGTWGRERHPWTRRLAPGRQGFGSLRGASGHEHNPFLLVRRPETTEASGEAYGLSLVYSGNFLAEAEVEPFGTSRLRLGIAPDRFAWRLEPGESFTTPEAILAFSDAGLGELSDALHGLFRDRLTRGPWRDRPRPVVLNSWEATYFDFDEARLLEIARASRDLGVELFVLDDGWFGERDDPTRSLGDWVVDRRKLPSGLDGLARAVEALGLRFGLWVEPEMVSERSELFRAHPDWAIGVPGRPRTPSRYQYVLDLSRPEVVDHLARVLGELLRSAPISYVKWDMNRNITEPYGLALPPERQGEFFHRYMLGLYELWGRLAAEFPDVLFESCASGGGRFDPGLLPFAPQAWTSDDTDAVERLRIQWGTSLAYPLSTISAHVSAVPNHQLGRVTPLATRAAVAFFGVFGYELDPTRLSDAERREVAAQIRYYAARRELFQRGRFVRLRSPFEGEANEAAWMVVSNDRRRAVVGHYRILAGAVPPRNRLALRGLDPALAYRVTPWWPDGGSGRADGDPGGAEANAGSGVVRGGDELMSAGLAL